MTALEMVARSDRSPSNGSTGPKAAIMGIGLTRRTSNSALLFAMNCYEIYSETRVPPC